MLMNAWSRNIQRDTIDHWSYGFYGGRSLSEGAQAMHEQFIEPTRRYQDIIIPQGGENATGIGILCR